MAHLANIKLILDTLAQTGLTTGDVDLRALASTASLDDNDNIVAGVVGIYRNAQREMPVIVINALMAFAVQRPPRRSSGGEQRHDPDFLLASILIPYVTANSPRVWRPFIEKRFGFDGVFFQSEGFAHFMCTFHHMRLMSTDNRPLQWLREQQYPLNHFTFLQRRALTLDSVGQFFANSDTSDITGHESTLHIMRQALVGVIESGLGSNASADSALLLLLLYRFYRTYMSDPRLLFALRTPMRGPDATAFLTAWSRRLFDDCRVRLFLAEITLAERLVLVQLVPVLVELQSRDAQQSAKLLLADLDPTLPVVTITSAAADDSANITNAFREYVDRMLAYARANADADCASITDWVLHSHALGLSSPHILPLVHSAIWKRLLDHDGDRAADQTTVRAILSGLFRSSVARVDGTFAVPPDARHAVSLLDALLELGDKAGVYVTPHASWPPSTTILRENNTARMERPPVPANLPAFFAVLALADERYVGQTETQRVAASRPPPPVFVVEAPEPPPESTPLIDIDALIRGLIQTPPPSPPRLPPPPIVSPKRAARVVDTIDKLRSTAVEELDDLFFRPEHHLSYMRDVIAPLNEKIAAQRNALKEEQGGRNDASALKQIKHRLRKAVTELAETRDASVRQHASAAVKDIFLFVGKHLYSSSKRVATAFTISDWFVAALEIEAIPRSQILTFVESERLLMANVYRTLDRLLFERGNVTHRHVCAFRITLKMNHSLSPEAVRLYARAFFALLEVGENDKPALFYLSSASQGVLLELTVRPTYTLVEESNGVFRFATRAMHWFYDSTRAVPTALSTGAFQQTCPGMRAFDDDCEPSRQVVQWLFNEVDPSFTRLLSSYTKDTSLMLRALFEKLPPAFAALYATMKNAQLQQRHLREMAAASEEINAKIVKAADARHAYFSKHDDNSASEKIALAMCYFAEMREPIGGFLRQWLVVSAAMLHTPVLIVDTVETLMRSNVDLYLMRGFALDKTEAKTKTKTTDETRFIRWLLPTPLLTWFDIRDMKPTLPVARRTVDPDFDYACADGMFLYVIVEM